MVISHEFATIEKESSTNAPKLLLFNDLEDKFTRLANT